MYPLELVDHIAHLITLVPSLIFACWPIQLPYPRKEAGVQFIHFEPREVGIKTTLQDSFHAL